MPNRTTERSRQWLTLADSVASALSAGAPLSFVIGAGASISSGAPSSTKLEQRWMDSDPEAYPNRAVLLEKLPGLSDVQKINPIQGLFEDIRPFIGYHCLAAIAKDRPVFVVNLNWDDALEQACAALSVPFHHFTVDRSGDLVFTVDTDGQPRRVAGADHDGEPPSLVEDPSPGVYCLQIHGKLGDEVSGIRIGVYDTLSFTPIVKHTIVKRFLCHPTVIVGASLEGEYDIVDLLRTLTTEPAELPELLSPFYMCSRQEDRTDKPSDKLTQQVLFTRSSDFNFRGDPAVDFDRLLLDLATSLKNLDFLAPFERNPIPSLEHLALPDTDVLDPPFHPSEHHAVVIEGDATVGRTVVAGLLGHMARLCEDGETSVEICSGPAQCADALDGLDRKPGGDVEDPPVNRVLILENPFGTTGEFRESRRFAKAFAKHVKSGPGDPTAGRARVIVTSRASSWRQARAEAKVSLLPAKVISQPVDDWYSADELTGYLESKVASRDKPLLRREIHKRELATPAAIDDAVFKGSDRRNEMIEEKLAFLGAISHEAAWCAVRARLQELWPNGVADLPIHSPADRESAAFAEAKLMLRTVELDRQTYVVPAHSIDREAIDRFFADRFADFEDSLAELAHGHGSPRGACELWRAVCALRRGDLDRVEALPEDVRLNWGPALLEEAARADDEETARARFAEVRKLLLEDSQHFWSLRELVFETIRLWPLLRDDRRSRRFLNEVLRPSGKLAGLDSRQRMGRYLVLEAMLYVQAATYPGTWDMAAYTRIWDELTTARYPLIDQPEKNVRELGLMLDACAWCPPRLERHERKRWLEPLAEAAAGCPQLRTVLLYSSVAHPEGFQPLEKDLEELGLRVEEHPFSQADADILAFLISWHFVHQSRARALLYRRSLEPAHAYLLHRIPGPTQPTLPPGIAGRCKRLVDQLSRFPEHAGWAVHMAMSVAVQRRGFDASFAAKHVADLEDGDQGAIAAAMTYDIPPILRAAFLAYFHRRDEEGEKPNLEALLSAMSEAHDVDGVAVGPPPFCASLLPWQLYGSLEVSWEGLEEDGIPVSDEHAFLEMLHSTASDLADSADENFAADAMRQAVREAASGDLRRLETAPHRLLSDERGKMAPSKLLAHRLKNAADELRAAAKDPAGP